MGLTVEEVGQIIYQMNESELNIYPDSLASHNRLLLVFPIIYMAFKETGEGISGA